MQTSYVHANLLLVLRGYCVGGGDGTEAVDESACGLVHLLVEHHAERSPERVPATRYPDRATAAAPAELPGRLLEAGGTVGQWGPF